MAQLSNYVLTSKISNDAKLLFAILDSYTGRDNAVCWPGQARLGADLGCGDRHVRDLLVELRSIGAVSWQIVPGPLGRKAIYTIEYGNNKFIFGGNSEGVRHSGAGSPGGGSGTAVPDGSGTAVPVIQHSIQPAIKTPVVPARPPQQQKADQGSPLAPAESGGGTTQGGRAAGQGRAGQREPPRPVLARTRLEREELEECSIWIDSLCAHCGEAIPEAEILLTPAGRRVCSVTRIGVTTWGTDAKGRRKPYFKAERAIHRDCALAAKLTK